MYCSGLDFRQLQTPQTVQTIGQGVFGTVYRLQTQTGQAMAIKVQSYMNGSSLSRPMLLELDALTRLRDRAGVVQLHGFCLSNGSCHLVMEALTGSLDDLIQADARQSRLQYLPALTAQMISALVSLEQEGLQHYDLAPKNILYQLEPEPRFVLSDFGLTEGPHEPGQAEVVTLRYRAPELLLANTRLGLLAGRVDVWSLGCTLVEFLTGRQLFTSNTPQQHIDQMRLPPDWVSSPRSYPVPQLGHYFLQQSQIDLIESMLVYSPWQRPGPSQLQARLPRPRLISSSSVPVIQPTRRLGSLTLELLRSDSFNDYRVSIMAIEILTRYYGTLQMAHLDPGRLTIDNERAWLAAAQWLAATYLDLNPSDQHLPRCCQRFGVEPLINLVTELTSGILVGLSGWIYHVDLNQVFDRLAKQDRWYVRDRLKTTTGQNLLQPVNTWFA